MHRSWSIQEDGQTNATDCSFLFKDRVLLSFLASAFLFHLANARCCHSWASLSWTARKRLGRHVACIIVTQLVIALTAVWIGTGCGKGTKTTLASCFVCFRYGMLYTLTHAAGALIAISMLDGWRSHIRIVSILVVKDRTQGTGRFNIAAGACDRVASEPPRAQRSWGFDSASRYQDLSGLSGSLCCFCLLWFAVP